MLKKAESTTIPRASMMGLSVRSLVIWNGFEPALQKPDLERESQQELVDLSPPQGNVEKKRGVRNLHDIFRCIFI